MKNKKLNHKSSAYQAAGVDIANKMRALRAVKKMVKTTKTPGVLSDIGAFGGMFASPGKGEILVASTDGVGTKLKVASLAKKHDTVGQDLVNHCVNDILVQGATPLFFLDYFGVAGFDGKVFQAVMRGLCRACSENNCALLGGETAEMPGLYPPGEYDLVGTIVGVVSRKDLITGEHIQAGDVLLGLPSSGLHTNGYSLARRIVFEMAGLQPRDRYPGTRQTVANALLSVHRSYLYPIQALRRQIRVLGMAHITGGGFQDNIPRMLPEGLDAVIDCNAWEVPPLFRFLQEQGSVETEEMYHVFNMGIGMVLAINPQDKEEACSLLAAHGTPAVDIGRVESGRRVVHLKF